MRCNAARIAFEPFIFESCCASCHEDESMGYGEDLWFIGPDGRDWNVCCAIARGFDKICKEMSNDVRQTHQSN